MILKNTTGTIILILEPNKNHTINAYKRMINDLIVLKKENESCGVRTHASCETST